MRVLCSRALSLPSIHRADRCERVFFQTMSRRRCLSSSEASTAERVVGSTRKANDQ